MNADFQRIASRDKKALLSDQCKEIEGKTECGPLEKGMATHFNILAWRILWTEEPGWLSPWGHKESDMTE